MSESNVQSEIIPLDQPHSGAERLLQIVSFKVGNEEFGLDILRVQEIIRLQDLTRVPNSPDFVDGVINLLGKVIPIIALRLRQNWMKQTLLLADRQFRSEFRAETIVFWTSSSECAALRNAASNCEGGR